MAPSSEMSIRWPPAGTASPATSEAPPAAVPARASSAASTLTAPSIPVATSVIATPTFVGPPPSASGAPVMLMSPLVAWMTKS